MNKEMLPVPVIAIDGPSASGKGSVAERVAEALGFHYLDSGAIYRILAYAAQQKDIEWSDAKQLAKFANALHITFKQGDIFLENTCITDAIRTENIGRGASEVAVHAEVRLALFALQQSFRKAPGLVADGRDMASVVFTDAVLKIFLTASPEIRAERRHLQLMKRGVNANYQDILNDLKQRDLRDTQRTAAPLTQTEDALLLDTSECDIAQAVEFILRAYDNINKNHLSH